MVESLHLAFIGTDRLQEVSEEIARTFAACGRPPVPVGKTGRATSAVYAVGQDLLDRVERWTAVGLPGAPGWTLIVTDPPSLLIEGPVPLIASVSLRLRVPAFQYNAYDGESHFMMEADDLGHCAQSGYVGDDPVRYWGRELPGAHALLRFRVVPVRRVASWAQEADPLARLDGTSPPLHPADVVRSLERDGDRHHDVPQVAEAILRVFGGPAAARCRAPEVVEALCAAAPPPAGGFAVHGAPRAHALSFERAY
jgi:hypothetical protein